MISKNAIISLRWTAMNSRFDSIHARSHPGAVVSAVARSQMNAAPLAAMSAITSRTSSSLPAK